MPSDDCHRGLAEARWDAYQLGNVFSLCEIPLKCKGIILRRRGENAGKRVTILRVFVHEGGFYILATSSHSF